MNNMILWSHSQIDSDGKEYITYVRKDTDFNAKFFNTTGIIVINDYRKNKYEMYPITFANGYPRLGDLIERGTEETLSEAEIEKKIKNLGQS